VGRKSQVHDSVVPSTTLTGGENERNGRAVSAAFHHGRVKRKTLGDPYGRREGIVSTIMRGGSLEKN